MSSQWLVGSQPEPPSPARPLIRRMFLPMPADRRLRRLVQLSVGLALFSFSLALQIRATLGLGPWDVFHIGVTRHVPLTIGTVSIVAAVFILMGWIPLRERPGVGTLSNVVVVGLLLDVFLAVLPNFREPGDPMTPTRLLFPAAMLVAGVVLNALAGALYIGAGLGPGPRDGLMTGLVKRTGANVAYVRGGIELSVLAIGFLLGGPVGAGTVLYALAIGPLLHLMLPRFALDRFTPAADDPTVEGH